MKFLSINTLNKRVSSVIPIIGFWVLFSILALNQYNSYQFLNVLGFIFLFFIPGLLTLSLCRVPKIHLWGYLTLIMSVSILELMLVGLAGNSILPFFSITQPLSPDIIFFEVSILIGLLIIFNLFWGNIPTIKFRRFVIFDNLRDLIISIVPFIFVAMSVLGSIRLNNGSDGLITLIMLILIAIYIGVVCYYAEELDPNVIPIVLFGLSLSLLLMTSLRGWYTTGHDIQREYRVFELTKSTGIWDIQNYKDAYNACLSITILPTVLSAFFKITDSYIYKILFQVIFAFIPGILFLSFRKFLNALPAFLAVCYFFSFPTFFTDIPMLNRQLLAFLFLILMFYIIYLEDLSLKTRRILFIVLGVGMILSHYSTTYTVIALLLFLVLSRRIISVLGGFLLKFKVFRNTSFDTLSFKEHIKYITLPMVFILFAVSFFWSSIITDTANNSLYRVIDRTIEVIKTNSTDNSRSGESFYNLFSWKKFDETELLEKYKYRVQDIRENNTSNSYYDYQLFVEDEIYITPKESLELSNMGNILNEIGIPVDQLNYLYRQTSAKALQLFIAVGMIYFAIRQIFIRKKIEHEFLILSIGSLCMLIVQVVLPVLSAEYGILRAFQQSLMFLSIFIVAGTSALLFFCNKNKQAITSIFICITFFVFMTGIPTQLLGGDGPQLHLNNNGIYYDTYYLHGSEIAGTDWVTGQIRETGGQYQSEVQTDRYALYNSSVVKNINPSKDIYPGLVQKDSYIYLGYTNVHKNKATVFYNGTLLTYYYPVKFLHDNKDLIYANQDVRIFK